MDLKPGGLSAGWEARLGLNGRIYYYSNHSHTVQILPPPEVWKCCHSLPYGWEGAIDYEGKNYYINHVTQSVTYEDPRTEDDQSPEPRDLHTLLTEKGNPVPRRYEIPRDKQLGFGFIAGSEKPVIIRSVTPGGPSEGKLLPDDQIVKINTENVMMADREHVIELIRSQTDSVVLTVLQPNRSANSSFLKPAKKIARYTDKPKVRFADDIIINGQEKAEGSSPLLLSPGILRIHLENGQTRSFQFQPDTTAGDAVSAICEKLGFHDPNLFSLVLTPHEEIDSTADEKSRKSSSRSSTSLSDQSITSSSTLDSLLIAPWDCLSKVVHNPSMRHHSCHFRLEFMPKDFHKLARDDAEAFKYLYQQCVNDVASGEVYEDDLTREEVVKLASIQMLEFIHISMPSTPTTDQSSITEKKRNTTENSNQRTKFRFPTLNNKITLKYIEKEYGLKRFLPPSIITSMQQDNPTARNIRKSIQQHLKNFSSNQSIFGNQGSPVIPISPLISTGSNSESTLLQLRMQYLKILSPQHLFGGRYFAASIQCLMESDITVLIGHHYGISQMINSKTKMVSVLAEFQHITGFAVAPCPAESNTTTVTIEFDERKPLIFSMEPQSAHNMAFMVAGYCRVYGNVEMVLTLPLSESTSVPLYFGPHKVKPSHWNYPPVSTFHSDRSSSASDVSIPSDITSPSYFYCDFSEPITPALLSQDSPRLDMPKANGYHKEENGHSITNGNHEDDYEALEIVTQSNDKGKLDSSDSNNNNSFRGDSEDTTYEEIQTNYRCSLPESPASSLSTCQYSDPSPSHSPRFESRVGRDKVDELPTSNGYLMPLPSTFMRVSAQVEPRTGNPEYVNDDTEWNELMSALDTTDKQTCTPLPSDFLPPPPSSITVDSENDDFRDIIVPPPPDDSSSPAAAGEKSPGHEEHFELTKDAVQTYGNAKEKEKVRKTLSVLSDSSSGSGLPDETTGNGGIQRHRMSSFKPNEDELKVFTHVDEEMTSSVTASSSSIAGSLPPRTLATTPQSTSGIENVQDPDTRRKLQETEDLIKYFREKREQMSGAVNQEEIEMSRLKKDSLPSGIGSNYATDKFSSEIDIPLVTSDIASGNKRLRKAEKAASRNRKSWAGDNTLNRQLSVDEHRPLSMSNPDISTTPIQKKRSRGFFRRVFGERKNRPLSMYESSGNSSVGSSGTFDLGRKRSGRRFRFSTPKLRLKRAFTLNSRTKKENSVIPSTDTTPKSRRFRFRPFYRKSKSHGILIISEPSDNVRGVDLLPSGKYTVAGTMFQVNGNPAESEVITLESDASKENLSEVANTPKADESAESPTEAKREKELCDESANTEIKLRKTSPSDTKRPVSFSTFQHPYDGLMTDASAGLPFVAERRRKIGSPAKSPRSLHTSQISLPESSVGSNSSSYLPKSDEIETHVTEIPVTVIGPATRRSVTLPPNFQPTDSLNEVAVPGQKLIRPVKPARKLIPAINPTVPADLTKSKSLPPGILSTEPSATSTPIPLTQRTGVKRKSSKKRRAPQPPLEISLENGEMDDKAPEPLRMEEEEVVTVAGSSQDTETIEETQNKWEEKEHFSRENSHEHSLVSEIFSYLENKNAVEYEETTGNSDAEEQDPVKDIVLPYDDNYVMPGVKTDEVDTSGSFPIFGEDVTEQQQQAMFQMFYDEMIAESRLTLGADDDVTDSHDDVNDILDGVIDSPKSDSNDADSEVDSDDSRNVAGAKGSYDVTKGSGSDVDGKNGVQSPEVYVYYGSEESEVGSDVCADESGRFNVNSSNEDQKKPVNNTKSPPSVKEEDCSISNRCHQMNTQSDLKVKSNRKNIPTRMPSYFTYQHLITPIAYEKTLGGSRHTALDRRRSSNSKPPLPPKPVFH